MLNEGGAAHSPAAASFLLAPGRGSDGLAVGLRESFAVIILAGRSLRIHRNIYGEGVRGQAPGPQRSKAYPAIRKRSLKLVVQFPMTIPQPDVNLLSAQTSGKGLRD